MIMRRRPAAPAPARTSLLGTMARTAVVVGTANAVTNKMNGLLYAMGDSLSGINGEIRPGIVHRIDKDTSGLLIVAKNDAAHRHLAEQIKAHSFTREYEAIVYGHFKERQFTVDAPIGRHKTDRKKMCVTEENSRQLRQLGRGDLPYQASLFE